MKIIKLHKSICYILLTLLLLVVTVIGGRFTLSAFAETSEYTSVLDDFQKDSNFNANYYTEKTDDFSLQIIQLAESLDKELFVYVYQPSGQAKSLMASSINISTTVDDAIKYDNYKLKLCNSSSTLFKYVVQNFTVSSEPTRYYAISSIYRPFDETIDKQADNDNKITEVNFEVSKQYCFSSINGKPYVSVVDIETITITDKFVGFVRYSDGHDFWGNLWGSCDSHFVAFNTDKPIDKLLEADVYYTVQSYSKKVEKSVVETFGDKFVKDVALDYTQRVVHTGNAWGAATYKWNRIETVEQFIAENDLTQNVYSGALLDVTVANKITEEGKTALKDKQWLLRFVETDYSYVISGSAVNGTWTCRTSSTVVGDVTILRLKFETDGVTYNLGTIDNMQTGSDKPINNETTHVKFNFWSYIWNCLVKFFTGRASLLEAVVAVFVIVIAIVVLVCAVKFVKWIYRSLSGKG